MKLSVFQSNNNNVHILIITIITTTQQATTTCMKFNLTSLTHLCSSSRC